MARRLKARKGHFMPPELLKSQFNDLEEPGTEENPIIVTVEETPDEITDDVMRALKG